MLEEANMRFSSCHGYRGSWTVHGATHPMRLRRSDEDISLYEKVKVKLADGKQIDMRMTASEVMVMDGGDVAERLGYTILWRSGKMEITHPEKEPVKVHMTHGCPRTPRKLALQI